MFGHIWSSLPQHGFLWNVRKQEELERVQQKVVKMAAGLKGVVRGKV
jgi:hypothetical protein